MRYRKRLLLGAAVVAAIVLLVSSLQAGIFGRGATSCDNGPCAVSQAPQVTVTEGSAGGPIKVKVTSKPERDRSKVTAVIVVHRNHWLWPRERILLRHAERHAKLKAALAQCNVAVVDEQSKGYPLVYGSVANVPSVVLLKPGGLVDVQRVLSADECEDPDALADTIEKAARCSAPPSELFRGKRQQNAVVYVEPNRDDATCDADCFRRRQKEKEQPSTDTQVTVEVPRQEAPSPEPAANKFPAWLIFLMIGTAAVGLVVGVAGQMKRRINGG